MHTYMCNGCGPCLDSYDMLLQNTSSQHRRDILSDSVSELFAPVIELLYDYSASEVLFCYYIVIFLETMLGER